MRFDTGERQGPPSSHAAMIRPVLFALVPTCLVSSSPERSYPVSDHFDGERFFNPGIDIDKSFLDLWRMLRSGERARWPENVDNSKYPAPPAAVSPDEIAVTHIGHAMFLLQFAGINVLTDPMYSERASPVGWTGPKRVRDPGVPFDALLRIDLVVLSHNHYDHMDLPTLRRLRDRWNPLIVAGLGNGRYLAIKGIDNTREVDRSGCLTARAARLE